MAKKIAYVVEDDQDLANIYSGALRMAGFDVETLLDGETAFNRINEKQPDFILLDMHLPNISGNEIIWVTWFDDKLEGIKITIITADPDMGAIYESKGYRVMIKPVDLAEIIAMGKEIFEELEVV